MTPSAAKTATTSADITPVSSGAPNAATKSTKPQDATSLQTEAKTSAATRHSHVSFVGAGPGDEGLLTLRSIDRLAKADVVVLDCRERAGFLPTYCKSDVRIVDAGADADGQPLTRKARAELLVTAATEEPGSQVVRLKDGDPLPFSGLSEEMAACRHAGISYEIVPGVSTHSAVPAYAGVTLTDENTAGIHVVHPHSSDIDWSRHADEATTVVVLGLAHDVSAAAAGLVAAGRAATTPMVVIANGTTLQQTSLLCTVVEAEKAVTEQELPGRLVALIGNSAQGYRDNQWFETKPLFGWRVLVPRTKDQATGIVHQLAQYGAHCDVVPTISVEPPRTPQQIEKAVKGLVTGRYSWIGFTSVNAVRAIREKFVEFGLDARAFAGIHVAAVGGMTASALREWGIEPDLVPEHEDDQSVLSLLQVWPAYDSDVHPMNRVFLPRADIATEALVAGLQETGWEVEDITAYRTVRAAPPAPQIREDIKTGKYDAVVFTSSSTVRNLVGIAGKPHATTVIACIGPASAATAEEHGLRVDVQPADAIATDLVDSLAEFGATMRADAIADGEPVRRPSQRKTTARRAGK